jgi:hypothetical protein
MKLMLPTPSSSKAVLTGALKPALAYLPAKMATTAGMVMTLAIGEQESKYRTRQQYGNGPAHGFWQNEKGGGVKGVLTHPASRDLAATLCAIRQVEATPDAVWVAMLEDDILAAGLARLLLWTDALALPRLGDAEGAWITYTRVWRPGKPRPEEWIDSYAKAYAAVGQAR